MTTTNIRQAWLKRGAHLATAFSALAVLLGITGSVTAQEAAQGNRLSQPVFRVARNANENPATKPHALDPALEMAHQGHQAMQNIRDYTCVLVKRERVNGKLGEHEFMFTKIRRERNQLGQGVKPFGVYMYFLKPGTVKGREVLWVKGQNKNKMIAHEGQGPLSKLPAVWLRPDGPIAMKGQLYPITEVGIENMIVKLIEKGNRDRQRDECQVEFRKGANINGRQCTMLMVKHPVPRPWFDFHVAQIFIDDELKIPIRYAAWSWPTKEGGKPVLLEEYTYLDLKVNVGLTDVDFDPKNKDYNFH